MRLTRTTILAGGTALLMAGTAAVAADKLHTLEVGLPDGSVAQIEDIGDVAPKVVVESPSDQRVMVIDPFAQLDAMAAAMEARHRAMIKQMAALQEAAASGSSAPPEASLVAGVPAGVHYTYYSATTDANGCTQAVQYSSDGSSAEPKVMRVNAGNCDAAAKEAGPVQVGAPVAAPPAHPAEQAPVEAAKLDGRDV